MSAHRGLDNRVIMNTEPEYDVCLLLEGTYPYVAGGVSTWIHNLIQALPEIRFTGLCILPTSELNWEVRYELPGNIENIQVVYLHDYDHLDQKSKANVWKRGQNMNLVRDFHYRLRNSDSSLVEKLLSFFHAAGREELTPHDMIYGREAWDLLVELYNPSENEVSFIDYFWTFRFTHLPIFKLLQASIPRAKIYHSLSTGYAGMLGFIAKHLYKKPLLLTEHGIYVKERKIEISQAEWIFESISEQYRVQKDLGVFQKFWINLFETLGRITYEAADEIYTLYEGNRQLEISLGADPDKIFIIPNGIAIEKYSCLKPADYMERGRQDGVLRIGLMGRVVPIKDVKTFIRACKVASLSLPDARFLIMGPTEEDKQYYQECREMVQLLALEDRVEFTGKIDVMDYYPILDLIVLTSVSEAQPLVILEANCAGIPVVASDVGSCRELLEGRTEEDQALGPSGIVTRVADPAGTARGITDILMDEKLWRAMSLAGRKRVEIFYRESDLNRKYLDIYRRFREANPA